MKYCKLIIALMIGIIIIVFNGSLLAKSDRKQYQKYGQEGDWSIRLGAIGLYKPEYEGSDNYEFLPFPLIDINWRDMIFLKSSEGLGAYLWNRDDLKIGLSIGYTFGRDENDSSDLDGLGDIEGGATANILLEWQIEDIFFKARYEHQFTGENTGYQIHTELGYDLRVGRKIMLKPSARTTYANSEYMEEYFSVLKGQSSRSGLPAYEADSGFKSVGFQILSIYIFNQRWSALAIARYNRLVDNTADSPVVKDENQYLLSLGLSYAF